jgi:hypothetical protein
MMGLRIIVKPVLFVGLFCALAPVQPLFASQAPPLNASIYVVDENDSKAATKDADAKVVEAEKRVEQIIKLFGVLEAAKQRENERPEAVVLLHEEICKRAKEISPVVLAALVIKKFEQNTAVCRAIMSSYDYTAMNQAQTDRAWYAAFEPFLKFLEQQYNEKTQAEEWRCLTRLVLGDKCFEVMCKKAIALHQYYVIDALKTRHDAGQRIDADFVFALRKDHSAAWIAYVQSAVTEASKEA